MKTTLAWLALFGPAPSLAVTGRQAPPYKAIKYENKADQIYNLWAQGLSHWKGNSYDPPPGGGRAWKAAEWPGSVDNIPPRSKKNRAEAGTPGEPLGPRKKPDRVYPRCGMKRDICVPESGLDIEDLAKQSSNAEFQLLSEKLYKLELPRRPDGTRYTHSDLRTRLKGLTRTKVGGKLKASGRYAAGAVMTVAGLASWIADTVQVFEAEESLLEQIATVTSIVPVIGCATRSAKMSDANSEDVTADLLCGMGDVLLFTPAIAVGLVVKAISDIMYAYKSEQYDYVESKRNEAWNSEYQRVWLSSVKSKKFRDGVQEMLRTAVAAELYALSERAGDLYANGMATIKGAQSVEEVHQAINITYDAWKGAWDTTCNNLKDMKSRLCAKVSARSVEWLRFEMTTFFDSYADEYEYFLYREKVKLSSTLFGVHIPYRFDPDKVYTKDELQRMGRLPPVLHRNRQIPQVVQELKRNKEADDVYYQSKEIERIAFDACVAVQPKDHGLCPMGITEPPPMPWAFNLDDKIEELALQEEEDEEMYSRQERYIVLGFYREEDDQLRLVEHGQCFPVPDEFQDSMTALEIHTKDVHCQLYRDNCENWPASGPRLVEYAGQRMTISHVESVTCYRRQLPEKILFDIWNDINLPPMKITMAPDRCRRIFPPREIRAYTKGATAGSCRFYMDSDCQGKHFNITDSGFESEGNIDNEPVASVTCATADYLERGRMLIKQV